MPVRKISNVEIAILVFVLLIVFIGYILLFTNLTHFSQYTVEDGLVEWITVLGLLAGSVTGFIRGFSLKNRKWTFYLTSFGMGVLLFLAAGEEISWGQRIFNIESSEYFRQNNTQGETNFHNLIVNGVRINRIIFSFLLIGVLSIYLIFIPILYRSKNWMRRFIDNWGVPLPKLYQSLSLLFLFALTSFMPHEKRAELLEAGAAILLFLIILFPANEALFEEKLNH